MLQSREITLRENKVIVFYFLCIYSHTPSPENLLFDVACNGVTVLVSRMWSEANPYPDVFQTLCNSISALYKRKGTKDHKG